MKTRELRVHWTVEDQPNGTIDVSFRVIGQENGHEVSTQWMPLGNFAREQLALNKLFRVEGGKFEAAATLITKRIDPEVVETNKADVPIRVLELCGNHSPSGSIKRLKEIQELLTNG